MSDNNNDSNNNQIIREDIHKRFHDKAYTIDFVNEIKSEFIL